MQFHSTANIDSAQAGDLPAMLATLGIYDRLFGTRHIQTLTLAAHIAEVLSHLGDRQTAVPLLRRVVRDLNQSENGTHPVRISALCTLRDPLLDEADIAEAISVQGEITAYWTMRAGPGAPEAVAARADLGELLMLSEAIEGSAIS